MSQTHVDGQVLTTCPSCGQSIRLRPTHSARSAVASPQCGSCNNKFKAHRETGDVLDGVEGTQNV